MAASSGVGFTGLLLIAFIVLKLCGVISWSWWWVMAPLWGAIVFAIVFALVVFGICTFLIGRARK